MNLDKIIAEAKSAASSLAAGESEVNWATGQIGALQEIVHQNAKDHGWWEPQEHDGVYAQRTFGDLIALVHSEASEALEEHRAGRGPTETYWIGSGEGRGCVSTERTEVHTKPEGIPIELADVVIRVLDIAGFYGIDLAGAIRTKMEFNKTRPYRHGEKAL